MPAPLHPSTLRVLRLILVERPYAAKIAAGTLADLAARGLVVRDGRRAIATPAGAEALDAACEPYVVCWRTERGGIDADARLAIVRAISPDDAVAQYLAKPENEDVEEREVGAVREATLRASVADTVPAPEMAARRAS